MEKTLSALLWGLSKGMLEKVREYRTSGGLIQTRALYVKYRVEDFVYDEGLTNYQASPAYIEKEEWRWKDQHDFIQKVVREIPEYSDCVTEISKRCQVSDQQAEGWLLQFVQSVVGEAVVGEIEDGVLVDQITTFISDLDKAPVAWKVEVWLDGIWLEDEQYKIEDGMVLRRPNPSDIETEIRFDLLPARHAFRFRLPSTILESAFRSSNPNEVQSGIEIILDVLRLFRLGSVIASKTEISPKSFLLSPFGGTIVPLSRLPITYQYALAATDVESLQAFLHRMKPLLPPDPAYEPLADRSDPLSIALHRYKDALLQPAPVESRITSAITCFEALYLKANERMELSHRLSQRASALLRLLSFTPLKVYRELSQAYEIRSTFIHGSQIEKDRQDSARRLCQTILEYARVSLIAFMQLKDTVDKEGLINKLDNSLLDENALQKVRQLFDGDLLIPK